VGRKPLQSTIESRGFHADSRRDDAARGERVGGVACGWVEAAAAVYPAAQGDALGCPRDGADAVGRSGPELRAGAVLREDPQADSLSRHISQTVKEGLCGPIRLLGGVRHERSSVNRSLDDMFWPKPSEALWFIRLKTHSSRRI